MTKLTIDHRLNDKAVDGVWYRTIDQINVSFRPEIEAAISSLYGAQLIQNDKIMIHHFGKNTFKLKH